MPRLKSPFFLPRSPQFTRPPLARMMRQHQKLITGDFPNCRKLADEWEVLTKAIQRDIDFMRDRRGLPVEYDQLHFGFVHTEAVTHSSSIEVSGGEGVALFVAQKAAEQRRGTPFEKLLRTAFEKFTEFAAGDSDALMLRIALGTTDRCHPRLNSTTHWTLTGSRRSPSRQSPSLPKANSLG